MAGKKLTGKQRLAVFLTAAWLILAIIISSIGPAFNLIAFFVLGVLPAAFIWGLVWVIAGLRRKG